MFKRSDVFKNFFRKITNKIVNASRYIFYFISLRNNRDIISTRFVRFSNVASRVYVSDSVDGHNRMRLRAKQPQQVREITILMFVNPDTDVKKEADRCLHILYRSFSTSLRGIASLFCEITPGRGIARKS